MSTLKQVMTSRLKSIGIDQSIAQAAASMRDARIGSLLVEKDGQYVGIITETDIVRKAVADRKDLDTMTVESIMSSQMVTIESNRSVRDAHDMMGDLGIRHLVVTEAGKIVGLVSARDLLVYFKSVSEPKIGQD
ncbi:MAG: CBS domain-containing protein [Nitrospirae bacterium]|nr:MAG: CBS domain-containing protein [Nitrospirota bacterium]